MHHKQRIEYLLNQCLQQRETAKEREELYSYLDQQALAELIEDSLLDAFYAPKTTERLSNVSQQRILGEIHSLENTKSILPAGAKLWRWAAAAAVVFLLGIPLLTKIDLPEHLLGFTNNSEHNSNPAYIAKQIGSPAYSPQEVAVLEIDGGEKIYLPSLQVGTIILKDGLLVHKTGPKDMKISYDLTSKSGTELNRYHIFKSPARSTYNLTLPDGSSVHLNASSTIKIPAWNQDSLRSVQLQGEAFFRVVKDQKKFVVYASQGGRQQEVRVYGTKFNIAAYPDGEQIETTLVEGSVSLADLSAGRIMWLRPSERVVFDQRGMQKDVVNVDRNLAWRSNLFYFEDEPIEEVFKQISKWHDVTIHVHTALPKQHFWGQVSREIPIEDILSLLEKTYAIKFQIVGKEVYVLN